MKVDLDKVEDIIHESTTYSVNDCLKVLGDRLKELGYKIPKGKKGEKKAYSKASGLWLKMNKDKFPEIYEAKLDDLPFSKVEDNGVTFSVHGVAHGTNGVSNTVKNFVSNRVDTYHSPIDGKLCLYESGMDDIFGFCKGKDFMDFTFYKPKNPFKKFYRNIKTEMKLKMLQFAPPKYRIYYNIVKKFEKSGKLSTQDMKHLTCFREIYDIFFLPEPLSIRGDLVRGDTSSKRSEFMADTMKLAAKNGTFNSIHSLVGYGHEKQIEYFLTHENERLKNCS